MSKKARVFVPLTKVDEEQRLVYGRITQEVLDKSGEVMDYETSKPHFQKWSGEFEEKTGGLSKGNLRVMHGLNVAGKLTDIAYDDLEKAVDVCAKVVDDGEWEKVLEGCYTGFSVGGRYGKKWNDTLEDGTQVKKYTAIPGEVSLVDDPCVTTATFSLVKANGETEDKMFKVNTSTEEQPVVEEEVAEKVAPTEQPTGEVQQQFDFTNDQVVEKATQIAKEANDGTTWMDHVATARDELTKAAKGNTDANVAAEEEKPPAEVVEEAPAGEADATANKVTPPGVKQVWTASDGKTFEKKADAEAHEATLVKAAEPKEETEADKLAARLEKALTPEPTPAPAPEVGLWEDLSRLSKVVSAISTPLDSDELKKGMYTVSRFANVLADIGSLTRSIARESTDEGGDADDVSVSDAMKTSLAALGENFLSYARDEITELLAGIDDEVVVGYYDYYYNVAHTNDGDQLAKDVCATINELRDPSREKRDVLAKTFGIVEEVESDEMSPALQKRFDNLTAENEKLGKIAEKAVEAVETLTKRVEAIEETPLPRAPNPALIAHREGDLQYMGKSFKSEDELRTHLHNMIKTEGPDAIALQMIKAAQAGGGQKLLPGR